MNRTSRLRGTRQSSSSTNSWAAHLRIGFCTSPTIASAWYPFSARRTSNPDWVNRRAIIADTLLRIDDQNRLRGSAPVKRHRSGHIANLHTRVRSTSSGHFVDGGSHRGPRLKKSFSNILGLFLGFVKGLFSGLLGIVGKRSTQSSWTATPWSTERHRRLIETPLCKLTAATCHLSAIGRPIISSAV